MADKRQREIVKNTAIITVGKICTQGISFLLLPLYTALLTPNEYGIVDLLNTYIAILIPLVGWSFDLGAFRFLVDVRDNPEKQKETISTILTTHFVQILFYTVLFFGFGRYINSEYKVFLFLDVAANVFLNTMLQIARGINRNVTYSFASFLSASMTVVLNVLTIAVFRLGALGMFISAFLGKVVAILYLTASMRIWTLYSVGACSKKLFSDISKYSFPCIPGQLSWWVVNASDRIIVNHFLGITINGIYSVANKFSGIYITIYNIFNLSWTEMAALHIKDEDSDEFFSMMINTVFSLFASLSLGIISIMPFIYPIMVDPQYSEGYYQVPILMIAVLCQVVCGLYSVIYLAVKKTVESAKTALFAAIINFTVNVVLIRSIGLYAASLSTLAAYLTMAGYRYFDSKKYVKMILKPEIMLATLVIAGLDVFAVYFNQTALSLINFAIVVCYCWILNRKLLYSAFTLGREKIFSLLGRKK